jgi:IclR family transcriptional regulator, KDG regulon repressor
MLCSAPSFSHSEDSAGRASKGGQLMAPVGQAKAEKLGTRAENKERGSQAVHRVLRILLCWKDDDATLSLTEVAQRTELTLPTAHRMIKALQREGFLVHDRISGRYALGPTIMDLARVLLQRSDQDELVVTAIPHLERMRAITGETVGLHLPMGDLRLCVAELVSRQPIRTATGVGRTFPLPDGASGKILIAWSEERIGIVESKFSSAQKRDDLTRLLKSVREQRYAISEGETIQGATALSLPIFGPNGDVRAAVNVTGPLNRWTRKEMLIHLPELAEEVDRISEQLGYRKK